MYSQSAQKFCVGFFSYVLCKHTEHKTIIFNNKVYFQ